MQAEWIKFITMRKKSIVQRNCYVSVGLRDEWIVKYTKNPRSRQELAELSLSSNCIADIGAQALGEFLPRCPGLVRLILRDNNIGNRGARALIDAIPECPSLIELDVEGNPIDKVLKDEIERLLKQNKLISDGFLAAAAVGNLVLLQDFLRKGANIRSRDTSFNTALHLSATGDHVEVLRFLFEQGLSLFARNDDGKSPLDVAEDAGQIKSMSFLMLRSMEAVGMMQPQPSAPPLTEPLPVLHDGEGINALPSAPIIGENTEFNLRESAKPPHIDFESIKLKDKPIASGGMGVVYEGLIQKEKEIPQIVAVKMLVDAQKNNEKLIAAIQKEYDILGTLYHPHVVQVTGYSTNKNGSFCLVMEYYPNGSLSEYIYSPNKWDIQLLWCLAVAEQVSRGLAFLHQRGLLHLDLKPENILLSDNWRAVIGDFGISRSLQDEHTHCSTSAPPVGTVSFIAPEILVPPEGDAKTHYSKPNDIFSLAVLLWCLMSQRRPFEGWNYFRIMMEVGNKQRREIIPGNTPLKLARLIERSWAHDALLRPTAEAVSRDLSEIYSEELARNPLGYSVPVRK